MILVAILYVLDSAVTDSVVSCKPTTLLLEALFLGHSGVISRSKR